MTTLATPAPLSRFERYLTLWVAPCTVAGVHVPIVPLVVRVVNATRGWYEAPLA